MKRETISTGLTLAAVVAAGLAWNGQRATAQGSEGEPARRTIQATGTATVRVHPDRARVFFGVQSFAPSVKQARAQNAAQTKQVNAALNALKIPDLKMKSANLTVELVQSEPDNRVPKIVGYLVTNRFTVLVQHNDAAQLGPLASRVLDTALENGANQVEQITFFRENPEDAKRTALRKAVEDARANAEAMAAGAGKKVLDVLTLNAQPEYQLFDYTRMTNSVQSAVQGDSTSLMAGEQEITCVVNATYLY